MKAGSCAVSPISVSIRYFKESTHFWLFTGINVCYSKLRLVYMDSLEQIPNLRHLITEKVEKLEKLLKNGDELQSPKDVLLLLISTL